MRPPPPTLRPASRTKVGATKRRRRSSSTFVTKGGNASRDPRGTNGTHSSGDSSSTKVVKRRPMTRSRARSMSSTPYNTLKWAVHEMEGHVAAIRKLVPNPSEEAVDSRDVPELLARILELADWIDKVSIQCNDVVKNCNPYQDIGITSEDERVAVEMEPLSTPSPQSLQDMCEEWGMSYDSDPAKSTDRAMGMHLGNLLEDMLLLCKWGMAGKLPIPTQMGIGKLLEMVLRSSVDAEYCTMVNIATSAPGFDNCSTSYIAMS